ncbi:MAG: hypothetical protein OXH65_02910 [Paracoccaceae bacterium]|nr:hypothetical protein [Paracoccaceae bacterium]
MKLIKVYVLALFAVVTMTLPAISETWGCVEENSGNDHPHLVELTLNLENKGELDSGTIKWNDLPIIQSAANVFERTRSWIWPTQDPDHMHLFNITDNDGAYYFGPMEKLLDGFPVGEKYYRCHKH